MQRDRVIIFAGTTEGRMMADILDNAGVDVLACVATEFGKQLIQETDHVKVSSDRLGEEGMLRIMNEGASCVIDATHPYATIISGKIRKACEETGTEYIRLLRSESHKDKDVIVVPDVASAVEYLKGTQGNILATTGSKELDKYTQIENYKDRVFARVLSMPTASQSCADIGFQGKNLFCMQGPFSEELNYGLLKQVDAKYMVTKDSGEPGGFDEKMRAARRAGVTMILIARPEETEGYSFDEVIGILSKRFKIQTTSKECPSRRKISIVGFGMGNEDTLTIGSRKAIDEADLLVGAERMIRSVTKGQDSLAEYKPDAVMSYVEGHPGYRRIAVLVSGDVGYHSAAKKLIDRIDTSEFDLDIKCGISSIAYLCSVFRTSWDDAYLMSAHGQESNIVGAVSVQKKVIALMEGEKGVKRMCRELIEYGLDDVIVKVGQDLGQDNERLSEGRPSELLDEEFGNLCIAMILNDSPDTVNPIGIMDDEFIRGDAPMTKSEIRSLSVIKLKLSKDSVLYDVGAGTGSVAIEAAKCVQDGYVYAIEKENEAVSLIKENRIKFKVPNLHVVEGYAPDALKDLPVPTHVFIGGSSGNLKDIMQECMDKNPKVRFVINTITLETISEVLRCMKELDVEEEEIVSINAARSRKAGSYHLMTANNPVYIAVCKGKG